ncbi:MAG: hypothetical protein IKZ14_03835 [Muribaculaceae bacterium]|nr:hypothetical protein [Muribaculaceae bacterium]
MIDQQRTNLADVEYLDLDLVANLLRDFENPTIEAQIFGGNSGYVGYSMSKRAAEAREEGRYPKTDFKKVYRILAQYLYMVMLYLTETGLTIASLTVWVGQKPLHMQRSRK